MDLSLVIPVRNEADNIAPLLAEIHAALSSRGDYEVIYVDDGSTDTTAQRLADLRRVYSRLRVLRHRTACGQSAAVLTGVRAARGVWIATLDGDGQNDPADIPVLLHARDSAGGDPKRMIIGHRQQRRDSALKRFSSQVANAVRARLLRDRTPDTGCGLKLFARATFLSLPHFDHLHRFLPALIWRAGGVVQSVPVQHRPRAHGRSNYGVHNRLWVGIVDLFGVLWLCRRQCQPAVDEIEEISD
ncbi:MAG: glycosyltransferase family 2 protein [Gammaproteobacteria bacterium]